MEGSWSAPFALTSIAVLNKAYRNEKDANLRERILLVRLVRGDKKEAASIAEKEFHRSRTYKWLKRFDNESLRGLKDKARSGRPPVRRNIHCDKKRVIRKSIRLDG